MRNKVLLEAVALTLFVAGTGGSVALAQHGGHGGHMPASQPAAVKTGKVKGTIVEVSPTSITVETQKKGQVERIPFLIDGQTKTKGELLEGSEVTVKYREENGLRTATSVEVKKTNQSGKDKSRQ